MLLTHVRLIVIFNIYRNFHYGLSVVSNWGVFNREHHSTGGTPVCNKDFTIAMFFCESARITRFPNWVDTLTWARFQSLSPMLLFLQTLLTPVRIMLLQIFYFSSQCAGDICFHRILACCQSNRGGACRSENVFRSSEFPPLSLLPLLPI